VTQSVFAPAICGPAVIALSCVLGATPVNSVMTPGRRDAADQPVVVAREPDVAVAAEGHAAEQRERRRSGRP
jgi:hypothetical protein